jgi:pSer/pThr/pTyr-binding forkhead associated (FHA) protein
MPVDSQIKLLIIEPNDERTRTIRHKEFSIGSDDAKTADLSLSDPCVSMEHGKIWRSGINYWYEDAGSTNGSKINEKLCTGPIIIKKGDRLVIGESLIIVKDIQIQLGLPAKTPFNRVKFLFPVAIIIAIAALLLINLSSSVKTPSPTTAEFGELVIKDGSVFKVGESVPFTGTSQCRYPNGQLWAKVAFVSGKENGPYEIWYEDGTLMHRAEYSMGIFSGSVTWWTFDGKLALEMFYSDGSQSDIKSHLDFRIPIHAIPQINE